MRLIMSYFDPSCDALAPADSDASELANTAMPPPANLGLLRELMATWTHWPEKRREVIYSQILTSAVIVKTGELRRKGSLERIRRRDVSPYAIPTDPAWLNAHLFLAPPKALGMAESTFSCTIWGLRPALREVGLLDPVDLPPAPPGSAWATLLDGIASHEQCRIGLVGFAAWCHRNGIGPDQVVDETLARYGDYRNTRTLRE